MKYASFFLTLAGFLLFQGGWSGCSRHQSAAVSETGDTVALPVAAAEPDTLVCDTLCRVGDRLLPQFCAIGSVSAVLFYHSDASSLRIWNPEEKKFGSYHLRRPGDTLRIDYLKGINETFGLLNNANNVYYEYTVRDGKLFISHFTRMRLGKKSPDQACRVAPDRYVCFGPYPGYPLALFHAGNRQFRFFGEYPVADRAYTSTDEFLSYYEGSLGGSETYAAYAASWFGYLACFRYEKDRMATCWVKKLSDFRYEAKPSRLVFDSGHLIGFSDVKIAAGRIFALYDGTPRDLPAEFPQTLLVYDLAGNLLARHVVRETLTKIAVSSDGSTLFAVYMPYLGESYLIRYRLP